MRGRNWCFRISNPTEDPEPLLWPHFRCCLFQHEIGELTGTPHIQGYIEFSESMRRHAVIALFERGTEIQLRMGTKQHNIDYCSKDNTRDPEDETVWLPDEATVRANAQGARNDIHMFVQAIKDGDTNEDLVETYGSTYLRYYKGAEAVRLALPMPAYLERPRDSIMYWGPTKTGKTYRLKQECPPGDEWFWCSPGIWFDGYQGQPGLVFNEIRDSWFAWEFILRLLDNAPRRNQIKGGTLIMQAYKFRFSSNVHPKKWYKKMKSHPNKPWLASPLRERFSQIYLMDQPVALQHRVVIVDDDEPSTSEDAPALIFPFN